ncbi:hypothetical protein PR202_gb21143 [Eleusine coracana subsp. coracana]|uniref:Uncharacterized protein n=1 Tax=Eleusine coracana subsp. coracana TaxID=191504 RepID=A0AAV5FCC6_ELECO|nr:hypothetical protein PR202_gb21143 [Eleusine coracana subsp. coracana]
MQRCALSTTSSDGFHSSGDGVGRVGNDGDEAEHDWDEQLEAFCSYIVFNCGSTEGMYKIIRHAIGEALSFTAALRDQKT